MFQSTEARYFQQEQEGQPRVLQQKHAWHTAPMRTPNDDGTRTEKETTSYSIGVSRHSNAASNFGGATSIHYTVIADKVTDDTNGIMKAAFGLFDNLSVSN